MLIALFTLDSYDTVGLAGVVPLCILSPSPPEQLLSVNQLFIKIS